MAKVSGDPLQQMRDQYQLRERESEARHREDLGALRETQRTELAKVREEAQKRIEDSQVTTGEKLNQRDLQHMKEIESLKAIYAKRASEGKSIK